jgi:hypothetical protein
LVVLSAEFEDTGSQYHYLTLSKFTIALNSYVEYSSGCPNSE